MQIFIGVNKNRKVSLHTVEPVRCMDTGKWVSSRPYVNSVVQKNLPTSPRPAQPFPLHSPHNSAFYKVQSICKQIFQS